MIAFEELSVKKGSQTILHDVTFSLRAGTVTALIGKNGSGKSTLLSCVNRLCPYEGTIRLEARDLAAFAPLERAKKIALLPQILPNTELTVSSLTALGRLPYTGSMGRLSDTDRQRIAEALAMTDMSALASRPCNTLSGGERQRAFLAMLLAQDAELLLLDEPTAFLDTDAANGLYHILSDLVQSHGKTVLAVMHDLSAAIHLADDIAILDGGTLEFFGTAEECLAVHAIERTFSVTAHHADQRVFFA